MTKKAMKGSCLACSLETQASDSTGFRTSLRQFISHLDEHQMPVCSQYGKVGSSCQLPTPGLSGED